MGCRTGLSRAALTGIAAVGLLLSAGAARAATYYVSPKGSDKAMGSRRAPFRTIMRAAKQARAGDRIAIAAGLYNEDVVPPSSGRPGRPIVFEGERGPKGEWKTIIDGSKPLKVKWGPAPEIGPGVYKTKYPGYEPETMLVDGKFIPRFWKHTIKDGSAFKKLAYPPDQEEPTNYGKAPVKFWDLTDAVFARKDGTMYIRFRNFDDPNKMDLRCAPKGGGVKIADKQHIVLRNLLVRGGESCVEITGRKATSNIVERCRLENARRRITITKGASKNIVRQNSITNFFYAPRLQTGAWGYRQRGPNMPYEYRLKQYFYTSYKHVFGPHSTSDYGVRVLFAGPGNVIRDNHVFIGGQGISVYHAQDTEICGNTVWGFSSIGIIPTLNHVVNARVHDNLMYDNNINMRIHHVDEPRQTAQRSLYVYRNRFYQKPDVGTHIYFHYMNKKPNAPDYKHAEVYIYQNSFCGGLRGLSLSGWADENGGLPKGLVVNNVLSTDVALYAAMTFIKKPGMLAGFDYNWLGGGFKSRNPGHNYTKAPWYGKHNIFIKGGSVWNAKEMPDFALPEKCRARHAGVDLSKPFEVQGKKYPPMPGMKPGYFTRKAPDMGAVQGK